MIKLNVQEQAWLERQVGQRIILACILYKLCQKLGLLIDD